MTRYSKWDEERHGASSHNVLNKCSNIITSVPVTAMQNLVWKYVRTPYQQRVVHSGERAAAPIRRAAARDNN